MAWYYTVSQGNMDIAPEWGAAEPTLAVCGLDEMEELRVVREIQGRGGGV